MTATVPPATDLRDCHLYRFWVRHPLTRVRVLGYVGETVRLPFERLMEHIYSQPWADTIIAWEVDDVVYPGKRAVLEAETFAIQTEMPLYNVRGNESNPARIPPPLAIRQRRARDAAKNGPRWVHPDDRGVDRPSRNVVPVRTTGVSQWWTPVTIKVCLWSTVWVLLISVIWGEFARHTSWPWTTNALCACLTSAALLGWGLWRRPDTWRLWRRRFRKLRRALK